jgi:hypothetical protein
MNVWEFRRRVRAHRFLLLGRRCPLQIAIGPDYPLQPMVSTAEIRLGLPYGYVLGVTVGFDGFVPEICSSLLGSPIFDQGERYGRRMRRLVRLRRLLGARP